MSSPHPSEGSLAPGALFAGRYRIVRRMAAGGMGAVYEVIHTETDRRRALKVMHPHLFESDDMQDRFKREARIAAQVESEYIVDVSDAGVDEATGTPFMVMELLQGEELAVRLKRLGPLPPAEVVTYLSQMGMALDKTHAKMIVHRDLKPQNVFLTMREDGTPRVKILDFGVAKLVHEGATGAATTASFGTPLYMAPEQFRAGTKLLPSADIYALGMMAYTLLVGEPYWTPEVRQAGDVIAFAMAVINGPQESPVRRASTRNVWLPPAFDAWFARITALNPAARFPRASDAARALGEVLGVPAGLAAPPAMLAHQTLPMAATPLGGSPAVVPPMGVGRPPMSSGLDWTTSTPTSAYVRSGEVSVPVGVTVPGAFTVSGGAAVTGPQASALERASTSTGASVGMIPARPLRSAVPLFVGAAVVAIGIVGVSAWFAVRESSGAPEPAGATAASAPSATISVVPNPVVPNPVVTEAPAVPASALPPATATASNTASSPTAAPSVSAKPTATLVTGPAPTSAPGSKPVTKPFPTKLIGRD